MVGGLVSAKIPARMRRYEVSWDDRGVAGGVPRPSSEHTNLQIIHRSLRWTLMNCFMPISSK